MQRRLQTARDEVAAFAEYDYVVVNDELDSCVDRMRAIVLAERARLRCTQGTAERIVATFTRSWLTAIGLQLSAQRDPDRPRRRESSSESGFSES